MEVLNPKDMAARVKVDLSMVPDSALIFCALAFIEGHRKYGAFNWRVAGIHISVYVGALRRHTAQYYNGEWADKATGVPHLASMIACCAIMIDAHCCGNFVDDRPPACDITKQLNDLALVAGHLAEMFPNPPERFTNVWTQQNQSQSRTDAESQSSTKLQETSKPGPNSASASTASGSKLITGAMRLWMHTKRLLIWLCTCGK